MYVQGIAIQGLTDLPAFSAEGLGRVVHLKGPSPAATAVGDAISLAFAALSEGRLHILLQQWGLLGPDEIPEIEADPLPTQAVWSDARMGSTWVADTSARRIRIRLSLMLDPPLSASLRALGAREPRLVAALATGAPVTLEIGAFFASSFDALSLSVQSLAIGSEAFPTTSAERPDWLTRFLVDLGSRFWHHGSHPPVAQAALEAMTSAHEANHESFRAWQDSLRPELGTVRPARGPAEVPILLADDRPLRRFGRPALNKASLAGSVFFSRADILWAGETGSDVDDFVSGDHSPLEQIWRVSDAGTIDPSKPPADAPRAVLTFSSGEE